MITKIKPISEEGRKLAREYLRYAGYLEGDKLNGDNSLGYEKVLWKGYQIHSKEKNSPHINNIVQKVFDLGFKEDSKGNFYDIKTGTIFSIIYDVSDEDKPEVIFCFKGLRTERHLDIDRKTRNKLGCANKIAAIWELFGGIPKACLQAIKLGKLLEEESHHLKTAAIGHSHGGGIAQIAALSGGIKGIVFNSRQMGTRIKNRIGNKVIQKNISKVVAFSGRGDFLTRTKMISKTASFIKKTTRFPVPRIHATSYLLPKAARPKGKSAFIFHHTSFYDQLHQLLKK